MHLPHGPVFVVWFCTSLCGVLNHCQRHQHLSCCHGILCRSVWAIPSAGFAYGDILDHLLHINILSGTQLSGSVGVHVARHLILLTVHSGSALQDDSSKRNLTPDDYVEHPI